MEKEVTELLNSIEIPTPNNFKETMTSIENIKMLTVWMWRVGYFYIV